MGSNDIGSPHTRDHWKCRDSSASSERRFWLIRPSPRHVRSADYSISSPASIFIISDDVCLFNEGAVTRRSSPQITGCLHYTNRFASRVCLVISIAQRISYQLAIYPDDPYNVTSTWNKVCPRQPLNERIWVFGYLRAYLKLSISPKLKYFNANSMKFRSC
jgi:hypothetical protein